MKNLFSIQPLLDNKIKRRSWPEFTLINGIFLLFFGLIGLISGVFFSGYHFMDDHNILILTKELSQNSLDKVLHEAVVSDFAIRLRPMYFIHRVIICYLFRDNFILWQFYNLFLAVISSWFLYAFARKLTKNPIVSLFFPFLTLAGPQTIIWWSLGPAETIGMVFFSASLYILPYATDNVKSRNFKFFALVFLIFLSSLCKESFIITIPAIAFLYIYFIKQNFAISYGNIIKKELFKLILLFLIFFVLIFVIILIGTNQIKYAGISTTAFPIKLFINFLLIEFRQNYAFFFAFIFSLVILFIQYKKRLFILLKEILPVIVFLIVFIIPQYVLYFKSGFVDRYYLPLNFGYAFILIFFINIINNKKYFYKLSLLLLGLILFLPISIGIKRSYDNALSYASEGKTIQLLIKEIKDNTIPSDSILIICEPARNFESSVALKIFLDLKCNRKLTFFFPYRISNNNSVFSNEFQDQLANTFLINNKNIISKNSFCSNYKTIVIFPLIPDILNEFCPNSKEHYAQKLLNNFVLYIFKN